MKSPYLNNSILLGRIILPSILCVLLIEYLEDNFWGFQFVLVFGIAIVLFNKQKVKHNYIASFLLSIVLSFLVLFLSLGISSGLYYFINDVLNVKINADSQLLGKQINDLSFVISYGIIAPLLMFYSYGLLFKIDKSKTFKYIKWISIIVLLSLGMTNVLSSMDNSIPISWQLIMVLALQLILYQEKIKILFAPKRD